MNLIKLAVVHWFPLEQYPPVTNLLDDFAASTPWKISAYSCTNVRGLAAYQHSGITLKRCSFPGGSILKRLFAYIAFPLIVFTRLLLSRPNMLLYVEPHSAFPVFLYCLVARRCRLFIHYHEYRDRDEYLQPGMRLVRFYHWLEKKHLFRRAEWISQTNEDRNRMFHEDFPQVDETKLRVLPNYPSADWGRGLRSTWVRDDQSLRLVYVGAVSLRDTFVGPLVDWLCGDEAPQNVTLDIYSYNSDRETREFLNSKSCEAVRFHLHGIDYHDIPSLLVDFHVGLILYKANSRNYVYNASNKLFEYLAMGLDVWFPPQMLGVRPYARADEEPRILETDFTNLREFDVTLRRQRAGLPIAACDYFCEAALKPLKLQMMQQSH